MVVEGITLSAFCEVLGYSDISQTYKYAHLANGGEIITNQVVFQWKVERIKLRQNIY